VGEAKHRNFRVSRGGKRSLDSESARRELSKSGLASHFGPPKCDFTRDLRLVKARVLINLPPRAPGGPEEGAEHYQHFEEIVGALRAQFFRSEFMFLWVFNGFCCFLESGYFGFQWILHIGFSRFWRFLASRASKSGGRGSVRRRRGSKNFGPKAEAPRWGRGGY
jgi:hypothetical protein